MKISDILKSRDITVSCELFPPKAGGVLKDARAVVRDIAALRPSFMSVTYGAGGVGAHNTVDIANEIQNVNDITALAHFTCVGSSRKDVQRTLKELADTGIRNILALRGDLPPDMTSTVHNGDFRYASDLVEEIHRTGDFCVGGACCPKAIRNPKLCKRISTHLK